jgi:hypothetical protein
MINLIFSLSSYLTEKMLLMLNYFFCLSAYVTEKQLVIHSLSHKIRVWPNHSHQVHYRRYYCNYYYYYYYLASIFTINNMAMYRGWQVFNHRTFSVLKLLQRFQINTVNTLPTKCADTKKHTRWKFHSKINVGSTNEHWNSIKISEFYIKTRERVKGPTRQTQTKSWSGTIRIVGEMKRIIEE